MEKRRTEVFAAAIAVVLIPLAFFEIVFFGNTLSTSARQRSLNGSAPPTGYPGEPVRDVFRLDPGASAWASEPWAEVSHRALTRGRTPLWNPHQGAGAPLAANLQSAALDPAFRPIARAPTPLRWDVVLLLTMVLGSVAMYAAGRVLGFHPAAALAGSFAYALSGFFLLHSNNMVFRPYTMLPASILFVELTVKKRSWWPGVALAGTVAETILMGFAPASLFVLTAAAMFGVWRVVRSTQRARRGARLIVAGAIGLALAAPLLLLAAEYVPQAHTIHVAETQLGRDTLPVRALANWFVPHVNGYPRDPIVGEAVSGTTQWVGLAVLLLAMVPLAVPRGRRIGHPIFFLLLWVLLMAKMYGFPLLAWIGDLPIANRVQWPEYGQPIAAFCLIVAAASGLHALHQRSFAPKKLLLVWAGTAAMITLLLLGNLDSFSASTSFVLRNVLLGLGAAAFVVVSVFLVKRHAVWVAAAAVALEMLVLVPRGIFNERHDPFLKAGWLEGVTTSLAIDTGARTFGLDSIAFPNTPAGPGLYDIRSIDALQPERYATYIRTFIEPEMAQRFAGTRYGKGRNAREITRASIERNPMFDLLGVRWVMAEEDSPPPDPEQFARVGGSDGIVVYENAARAPRAFVVGSAIPVGNLEEAVDAFVRRSRRAPDGGLVVDKIDVRASAVVEVDDATGAAIRDLAGAGGSARIESYLPEKVVIRVRSEKPALLILTDTWYPGWRARVDGREAPILPANILFRAVPVPGDAVVELTYEPRSFRMGSWIAWGGAIVSVMLLMNDLVRRVRRRKSPATPDGAG